MHDIRTTLFIPSTARITYMMGIYNALNDIGVECRICTNPQELRACAKPGRGEAYLIDGAGESDFDIASLAAALRGLHSSFVALLVDEDEQAAEPAGASAAHLYLYAGMGAGKVAASLMAQLQQWRKARPASAGQGPRPASPYHDLVTASYFGPRARAISLPPGTGPGMPVRPPAVAHWPASAPSPHSPGAAAASGETRHDGAAGEPRPERQWTLSSQGWRLTAPGGKTVRLTAKERELMAWFRKSPDLFLSHDMIEDPDFQATFGNRGLLCTLISRLRQKCNRHGMTLPIRSRHRKGYLFGERIDAQ